MTVLDAAAVVVPTVFRADPRLAGLAALVPVPPAPDGPPRFVMGAHASPAEMVRRYGPTEVGHADAQPREATLPGRFLLMSYPVANALFAAFIAARAAEGRPYVTTAEQVGAAWALQEGGWRNVPGACWKHVRGAGHHAVALGSVPVTCVSWHDAVAFTDWLTEAERRAGTLPEGLVYRLPAEAEWEFACRAGSPGAFWWGDELDDEHAIHRCGRQPDRPGPAPAESPLCPGFGRCNRWGLSDMLGNVWEWCADAYPRGDPRRRVLRGGSWGSSAAPARLLCCFRGHMPPDERGDRNGFRVALGAPLAEGGLP